MQTHETLTRPLRSEAEALHQRNLDALRETVLGLMNSRDQHANRPLGVPDNGLEAIYDRRIAALKWAIEIAENAGDGEIYTVADARKAREGE